MTATVVFVVVVIAACAFLLGVGLPLLVGSSSPSDEPNPLVEACELRAQLHEMAHATRVEMIRAAREAHR